MDQGKTLKLEKKVSLDIFNLDSTSESKLDQVCYKFIAPNLLFEVKPYFTVGVSLMVLPLITSMWLA